jgi:hypothetical protein
MLLSEEYQLHRLVRRPCTTQMRALASTTANQS